MTDPTFPTRRRPAVRRSLSTLLGACLCLPLAAQHPADVKPAPLPDPVKGMHDQSPMSDAEMAARRAPYALPAAAPALDATAPMLDAAPPGVPLHDRVIYDEPGDGRLWAASNAYKASFGADGFVYVPFFGAGAERNFPVRFVLRAVRVGGRELDLRAAPPVREGDRVAFHRGAVREQYELGLESVEQTFVIDTALAGDVEVEVAVDSELVEDAATEGIQFANALGCVCYGAAHVVDGAVLRPVPTTFAERTIRIHVPAAERPAGAVVIDPIIHTSAFTLVAGQDSSQPDIAYDVSSDRYLAVWQYHYSATDIDIYCEFRNGDGTAVAGSLGVIDVTTLSHSTPRVASLNAFDRFLVVMQRYESNRWQIWGRLRLAGSPVHPNVFPISDPAFSGHCINADVGGDSADAGACDNWLVVWQREFTANDFDIHARMVRADTAMATGTLLIENSGSTIHSLPSVSQSNGNGFSATPRWLVAYQFRFSATDEDVYGCAISQDGTITTPNSPIDTNVASDLYPSVSTPNTDFANGNPLFLVTYERQNPFAARARLLSGGFVNQIPPVDLSATFGLGPFWVRAECDGNRFAVTAGAATINVATFAYTGSGLVVHDAPQALSGTPSYPRLCSKRSGGGTHTDYGIAYIDENTTPDRILVSAYRGHGPADISRRVMGCSGLNIDAAGLAFLGETLTFSLSNVGFDIPGFVFGTPVPATNVICAPCPLGVSTTGAILVVGSTLPIAIPPSAGLAGASASVQGFALGSGPCVASLRFSDTLDFTVF